MSSEESAVEVRHDDYATDDASLCDALDEDLRETISELAEERGQTSAGVVKAAVVELVDRDEHRVIDFEYPPEARGYYRIHKRKEREFAGAYEELKPDVPDYENPTPAQPLHELLRHKEAEHRAKARAAARWMDENDPEFEVATGEYGAPVGVPKLDDVEVQHGE